MSRLDRLFPEVRVVMGAGSDCLRDITGLSLEGQSLDTHGFLKLAALGLVGLWVVSQHEGQFAPVIRQTMVYYVVIVQRLVATYR